MTTNNSKALTIIEEVKSDPQVIVMQNRLNEVKAIHQAVFQKGVHYGAPYKGAKNDTLLKPGATFLQQKYGLRAIHERLETTIHVDTSDLSKSYIIIQDRCRITNEDGTIEYAQADAACSTFEDKYVYRGGGDRTCPECGKASIMRSGFAPRNNPNAEKGWYCNPKSGGCGKNFDYQTSAITEQTVEKKLNENPLNLLDTVVAMAQKRAEVRATIKATGVDALFAPGDGVTVNYYDDVVEAEVEELDRETGEIKIVSGSKTMPQSHQGAILEDLRASTQNHTQATNERKNPFTGNGSTAGRIPPPTKDMSDVWPYDFQALMKHPDLVAAIPTNPHRANAINEQHKLGKFANARNISDAVKVVLERNELPEAS